MEGIINKSDEYIDEIYLQLYRNAIKDTSQSFNTSFSAKDFYERSLTLMCIISYYSLPSFSLIDALKYWLYSEIADMQNIELSQNIKEFIVRLESKKKGQNLPIHYWIPSTYELESKFSLRPLLIYISYMDEDTVIPLEVSPHVTVSHVMTYIREKSQISQDPGKHFFWIFKKSGSKMEFDKALPGEAK